MVEIILCYFASIVKKAGYTTGRAVIKQGRIHGYPSCMRGGAGVVIEKVTRAFWQEL